MNARERGSRKGMKKRFLPALLLAVMIAAGTAGAGVAYADDPLIWNTVHLWPGETYDVSKAGWNTTVFIRYAGNYTLKGKSSNVRVLVECGGANVYLADGLDINCSATSYTATPTAAIWVEDNGGTVKLISKKKANVKLEGYMCPAIRKEGMNTKLVFETEDPDYPGTIRANSGSRGSFGGGIHHPSAIGSFQHDTGNMVFNSGNVVARIRGDNLFGAAIGGASDANVGNITVNGGHIDAYGSLGGAGIGAGAGGLFNGFYVNGGTVYAENDVDREHLYEGAAIGGGRNGVNSGDQTPGNIGAMNFFFKGGKVTAVSYGGGAAIGGGTNSGCSNINIEGGEVNATCKSKTAAHEGYGAGIGGGDGYKVHTEVNISGGKVTAKGGPQAPGIGSQDKKETDTGIYRISGGTIYTGGGDGAHGDIGTRDSKVIVTGGNLHVGSIPRGCSMVNGKNEPVHRQEISFDGIVGDGHAVRSLIIQPDDYSYGMKDVETMDGKLHAWLPDKSDHAITGAWAHGTITNVRYGGNTIPFTSSGGTLNQGTIIALLLKDGPNSFLAVGTAWGIPGETSLVEMNPPRGVKQGYKISKYICQPYWDDPGKTADVAEPDGTLHKNVYTFTDADGKWKYYGDLNKALTAIQVPIAYQVKFDPNVPKNASTKLSGEMENQEFKYDVPEELSPNQFALPGYRFNGWKTAPDAPEAAYTDRQSVSKLTDKDGDVVTLYADWTPEVYTITYSSGLGDDKCPPHEQKNVPFDQTVRLDAYSDEAFGWQGRSNPSYGLHGWTGTGSFYDDNASVTNLCTLDGSGKPVGGTLTAEWVEEETIMVSVTKDSVPQESLAPYLFLIRSEGDRTPISGMFKAVGTGAETKYVYDPADHPGEELPDGTYELWFDPAADTDTGTPAGPTEYEASFVEITYGGETSVSTVFDYYTVTIAKDPAAVTPDGADVITSAWIAPAGGTLQPATEIIARDGVRLDMQSRVAGGYHFDGYSVMGVTPGNGDDSQEFDPSKAKQAITVRGTADIMAHAEANVYTVHFDPNATIGISGEMEDQDMVYDQPQNLFANQFERTGAIFFGWNTKKDGSGTEYTNGERVENLTADSDAEVTLYAQWGLIEYPITYTDDIGHLPEGKTNPEIYTVDMEPFTLVNPVSDNYDFTGWMGTDLKEPAKTVTIEENSTGERHYTATWTLKYFHVNFKDNGGSGVEPQLVPIHGKAAKPADPTRKGYDFAGWYADAGLTAPFDFSQQITKDTAVYAKWKPAKAPVLMAWGTSSGKKAVKTRWQPVDGAAKYLVYAGTKSSKLKLVKKTGKTTYTVKKIKGKKNKNKKMKAHKCYIFCVAAVDKDGKLIATSRKFHVITGKTMGKYANIKKITAKKKAITLGVGQTATLKAKVTLPKGKKHLNKKHGAKFRYTSDYPNLVSVSSKGQVRGLEPGTATVYIQDTGGKYCRVTVTVQ